jgi:hypothetical protein
MMSPLLSLDRANSEPHARLGRRTRFRNGLVGAGNMNMGQEPSCSILCPIWSMHFFVERTILAAHFGSHHTCPPST